MASWRNAMCGGLAALVLSWGLGTSLALAQTNDAGPPAGSPPDRQQVPHAAATRAGATSLQRPLAPPADPVAATVYAVLDKHCARCHQAGRLDRPAPAAAFGNILRLDEVAATPRLVQPANPDASRLYVMMLRGLMPVGTGDDEHAQPSGPTADEIAQVRTWISGLAPRQRCADRRLVTTAEQAATLRELRASTAEDPKKLRFLSLAHIHNGCARFEALAAYRQGIVRLINSLSWKAAPVAVPPVDPARTLFKVNLDDLGWLPEHWERIMAAGASPRSLTPQQPEEVRRAYGTDVPVARADWFAQTVLGAPLYYEVLGLPGTGPELQKILQVADPAAASDQNKWLRAAVSPSHFSARPSVIERAPSRTGAVWHAYHWPGGDEARGLAPDLAPDHLPAIADITPPYLAALGMFRLPNGLPGFFVVGQRGDRLDALPPDIARESIAGRRPVSAGLDCMACHRTGASAQAMDRAAAAASAISADAKAVSEAMRRVGLDPDLTLDGVTPVVALAAEYTRPLDAARVAAELGVDVAKVRELADRGQDGTSILARRLVQGLVTRAEVEARAPDLIAGLAGPKDAGTPPPPAPSTPATHTRFDPIDRGPGVILYSDKVHYRKGDRLQLVVKTASTCHLTVISVDTRGRGTVLFPSDFETSGLLVAGQELKLPGPGAPYAFRLNDVGRETIVALCNEAGTVTDNIRPDFERQRFTELGNYAAFLAQNATIDQEAKAGPSRDGSRGRGRGAARDAAPEAKARPDQISRAAISIWVE